MLSFGFCTRQSNHANISSLNCSSNRCTIKNTLYWRLWFQGPELKPSFVSICLFLYSVAFSSVSIKKRSLFSNGSIFLRTPRDMEKTRCDWLFSIQIRFLLWSNWTHVGPANNVSWLVTIIQICFLLWSRSQRPRDLQISPYDWSELFQIFALLWQGWRRMFSTASLRTLENHSERCMKFAFFFNLLKKVHQPLSWAYPLPLKYLRKSHFALITTHFRGNFFSIQVT